MGLYEGGGCELCLFRRECRLRAWEVEEARARATEWRENAPANVPERRERHENK